MGLNLASVFANSLVLKLSEQLLKQVNCLDLSIIMEELKQYNGICKQFTEYK